MKRLLSFLFVILLFTGCSRSADSMDRALSFRQMFLKQNGCIFDCALTADYGDVLYQFSLNCQADKQGNLEFTVVAPESISGITGTINSNGGKIKFDNTVLGFPILSEDLPTPLSAPWLFISALRSGYIRACSAENDIMSLSIADTYDQDSILMQLQFDAADRPIHCEFIWKGRKILSMQINSFTYL